MRKPIVVANWKMYKTREEAAQFCQQLLPKLKGTLHVDVAICAPFTQLDVLAEQLHGTSIDTGAQNFYPETEGAYTGEISPAMLKELEVRYVLVGHSERREIFGESAALIQRKVAKAYAEGLQPILCVGEKLEQRQAQATISVCTEQLLSAIGDLTLAQIETLIVAYEPVWAIGTGQNATAEDAQAVVAALRQKLAERYGESVADSVRFQYGGSVKPENVGELMAQPDIDGVLVGGASLKPESFYQLIENRRGSYGTNG